MVKALRRWLEANELFAIVTGVVGALVALSMLLVFGGYLIVARQICWARNCPGHGSYDFVYRFQSQMPPDLHGQT